MRREAQRGLQVVERVAVSRDIPRHPPAGPHQHMSDQVDVDLAQARALPLDQLLHELQQVLEPRDLLPRIVDRLEPSQDLEVRRARVVERGAGLGAAGEELLAEPGEVGDPMTPGLVGEGLRVERLRGRRGAGPGAHQGHRVDPVPRQPLRGRLLGQAGDRLLLDRRCDRHEDARDTHRLMHPAVDDGGPGRRVFAGRGRRGRRHRHLAGAGAAMTASPEAPIKTTVKMPCLRMGIPPISARRSSPGPPRPAHFAAPAGVPSGTIRKSTCPSWMTAPVPIGASYRTRPATGAATLQRPT